MTMLLCLRMQAGSQVTLLVVPGDEAALHPGDRSRTALKLRLSQSQHDTFGRLRTAQDLPELSAWHIILVLAQPRRKRDPDSPMGEAPALGQIVEDHLGSVLVGDS